MITIFLADGLGNQMFQYAFARALQLQTKREIQFSLVAFDKDLAKRSYGLHNFNADEKINLLPDNEGKKLFLKHKILNKLRLLKGHDLSKKYIGKHIINAYTKDVFLYEAIDYENLAKKVTIFGQFQNPEFFKNYEDVISKELKVKTEPSVENKKMLEQITDCNSVCVHIRRGDYLNPEWSYLNICNYDYYKKAMERVKEKVENPVFYIFSNTPEDIAWIKEHYDFSEYNVEYVDLNNPDYEELRLMYSCKHFIISNSTFSWWAQYLGEYENKVVVAPSEWNREVDDCSGIYMPDWEIVEV